MNKNVLEWLEESVNKYPDKVAYLDLNEQVTFKDVMDKAKRVGSSLLNIKDQSPIAIIGNRKISTIIAYLGIVYSGHAYAPIDGSLPKHRIEAILSTLNPSAILCDEDNKELALELSNNEILVY